MSTPLFDPEDPRLTAYALGEATVDERQAVEEFLASSPEARAAVEQTRVLARQLEEEFARENATYQQAHAKPLIAANIVPFPGATQRRWQPAVALVWKLAAVLVAVGSLVWLVGRRTPLAQVASVRRAAPTQEVSPDPSGRPEPAGNIDQDLTASPAIASATADAAKPEDQPAAPPVVVAAAPVEAASTPAVSLQAPGQPEGLLAQASKPEARGSAAMLDKSRLAPGTDRAAPASSAAEAPFFSAAQAAPLAPPPAAPKKTTATPSVQERLAAAVVRIRFGDRTYAGGVLLTANGWLFVGPQSSKGMPALENIALADGRKLPNSAFASEPGTNWALLRVRASQLPYVSLATETPADGDRLIVARFDVHTGAPSFVDARAVRRDQQIYIGGLDGAADMVFNEAGELLVVDRAAAFRAAEAARARAKASRSVAPVPVTVRPYTAAERDTFNRLMK